jgi:hypothetical protein
MCVNRKVQILGFTVFWVLASQVMADVINYWRFEEGSGTSTADETGLAPGTLMENPPGMSLLPVWSSSVPSSTVPQTGQANNSSLQFFSGGNVGFSPTGDMDYGTDFTVEMYVRFDDLPTVDEPYSFFRFTDSSTGSDLWFLLGNQGGGDQFRISASDANFLTPTLSLSTDQWYHFATVRSNDEYNVYLDGASIATSPSGSPGEFFSFTAAGTYTVGSNLEPFSGYLDEIRISNVALSPDQFLNGVPEPTTFLLTLLGLFVFSLRRRNGSSR